MNCMRNILVESQEEDRELAIFVEEWEIERVWGSESELKQQHNLANEKLFAKNQYMTAFGL